MKAHPIQTSLILITHLASLDSMKTWTLEKAKNGFSEVVRRALDHQPQLVTRGRSGNDAVVVVAREDYEKLVAPRNLVDVLSASPVARALADFEAKNVGDPFAREPDFGRSIDMD